MNADEEAARDLAELWCRRELSGNAGCACPPKQCFRRKVRDEEWERNARFLNATPRDLLALAERRARIVHHAADQPAAVMDAERKAVVAEIDGEDGA